MPASVSVSAMTVVKLASSCLSSGHTQTGARGGGWVAPHLTTSSALCRVNCPILILRILGK